MKLEMIGQIKELLHTANVLETIQDRFREATDNPKCDKYALEFGGDDRFAVFSVPVLLSCYTGYYGNSACSTFASIDKVHARRYLNAALNKHMTLILKTMADMAKAEALEKRESAEAEIAKASAMLEKIVADAQEQTP